MPDILELAESLGKAIADSPQAASLQAAREAMEKDKALTDLMDRYHAQAEKIAQLEHEQKPVEVEDKHKLRGLQSELTGSDAFKKYTAAQVEYADLLRRVNQAIHGHLARVEGD